LQIQKIMQKFYNILFGIVYIYIYIYIYIAYILSNIVIHYFVYLIDFRYTEKLDNPIVASKNDVDSCALIRKRASFPFPPSLLKKHVAQESRNQTNQFSTNGGRALVTLILLLASENSGQRD